MPNAIVIVGAGFCGTVLVANLLRRPPSEAPDWNGWGEREPRSHTVINEMRREPLCMIAQLGRGRRLPMIGV